MIADPVLRFVAQTIAQREIGANLEIVLEEQPRVEERNLELALPAVTSYSDGFLAA